MCGIYSIFNFHKYFKNILNLKNKDEFLQIIKEKSFMLGKARGPDDSEFELINDIIVGFHRLAINGLNEISNQPLKRDNCILICNGEIYNYKELSKKYDILLHTNSDCEIIIPLFKIFGFDKMIQMLDGVFSFMLVNIENDNNPEVYIARDPFGIRPLYILSYNNDICGISSTLQPLSELAKLIELDFNESNDNNENENDNNNDFNNFDINNMIIKQFIPGSYQKYTTSSGVMNNFIKILVHPNDFPYEYKLKIDIKWHCVESLKSFPYLTNNNMVFDMIRNSLYDAVLKRVHNTDREICCLLSGGLDSSLITSIVHKFYQTPERLLKTFSIGLNGSEDLKYAKIVADYLGTDHTEVIVSEEDFLNSIPEVIKNIESYDTTSVRASVGNYLVSKYIRQNSNCKVVFNGDGADELMGGYLYMHCAPNENDFDNECRRLLNDICYFDVLRSDRSISSNGLEPRTPFLDKTFVATYLSIPEKMRFHAHKDNKQCEKWLIRKSFEDENLLPKEVLWRTKEAFSDGVSSQKKSWFQIIQDYVNIKLNDNLSQNEIQSYMTEIINTPKTYEQIWYRWLFENEFNNKQFVNVIPYFWMPKFIENANDASARTLNIYKEKIETYNNA